MQAIAVILVLAIGQAEETPPQPWQSPAAAFQAAAVDAQSLGGNALYCRYVHMPVADENLLRWHVYTVNECVSELRNPNIIVPQILSDGHLVRWDLRQLAPSIRKDGTPDVFRLMEVWDKIFDETLSVRLVDPLKVKISVPPYRASDGKTYTFKLLQRDNVPDAIFEPSASQLMGYTFTNVPMVSLYEFQRHAMTTLDGGLYYEFLGLPATAKELLAMCGVERGRSSEIKAVSLMSGVTNAPRRIIVARNTTSRPSDNQGLAWITEDFAHGAIDVETDPTRNLHGEKHDASEIIIERPNGGHIYFLANGSGDRQASAPDTIATDTTISASGDRRLQPARSCVVCHARNQERGVRSFTKDIQRTLAGRLDYAADRDTLTSEQIENLSKTAGMYEWSQDKMVSRARDDYSDFMIRATANLQPEDVGEITRLFFHEYWESPVNAEQACIELGLVPGANPAELLSRSLPPRAVEVTPGLYPEDPYIAALCSGRSITRSNFLQVVLEMRRRLQPSKD